MSRLLVIKRVDVSHLLEAAETPVKRFSKGVASFVANGSTSQRRASASVPPGSSHPRTFSLFGAPETSQLFFGSRGDQGSPSADGSDSRPMSSTSYPPRPPPGATPSTTLPSLLPLVNFGATTRQQPSDNLSGFTNPYQCMACGRLPPARSSNKGGRPYPDTPFEFSSATGSYTSRNINTAEKRVEATYQNQRRQMLLKRTSTDAANSGGPHRPLSSSLSVSERTWAQ